MNIAKNYCKQESPQNTLAKNAASSGERNGRNKRAAILP
jgi:hypothetical protein